MTIIFQVLEPKSYEAKYFTQILCTFNYKFIIIGYQDHEQRPDNPTEVYL